MPHSDHEEKDDPKNPEDAEDHTIVREIYQNDLIS